MASSEEYRQLDQVRLKTTRRVDYLSAPSGAETNPEGVWTVSAVFGEELLLTRQMTVIKIPANDVELVSRYDISSLNNLRLYRGQEEAQS